LEAHGRKCAYCWEPVSLRNVEIDHIIPESLAEQPDNLANLLQQIGLPATFDLRSDLNLVPACSGCNTMKRARTFSPPREIILLEIAAQKSPRVASLRAQFALEVDANKHLDPLATAVDNGAITVAEILDALCDRPGAPSLVRELAAGGPPSGVHNDLAIATAFGNVSEDLLTWPQETAGHWMERPEEAKLRDTLSRAKGSFTAVLGEPGAGKSALLAHIGKTLRKENVALLAIKADMLPRNIGSLKDLDQWLQAPAPLTDCLRELARKGPVVLLLDQVDALSELMDRHTGRLNALVSLVRQVDGTDNLHILMSCRSFEFHHDIRLRNLNSEPIQLDDPSWDQVLPILRERGFDGAIWPQHMRDLLRRPQHLNIFIDQFTGADTPVFEGYQGMLEAVFQLRVPRLGGSAMKVLETIAAAMADDEELWIALARLQTKYHDEIQALVAIGLLRYNPDRLRVSFRHQTLFDFVRARSFAARSSSLSEYVLAHQDAVFIRPNLWRALPYLRAADRKAYVREVGCLWNDDRLRVHVRLLLLSFLGRLKDPDSSEECWVFPGLDDRRTRRKTLLAMAGSVGWLSRMKPRLPSLMTADDTAEEASVFLGAATQVNADTVLELIEQHWLLDQRRDLLVFSVLASVRNWTEHSASILIKIVGRSRIGSAYLGTVVDKIEPALACRVIAAHLWQGLQVAQAEKIDVPPLAEGASEEEKTHHRFEYHDATYRAIKHFAIESAGWHEMDKLAVVAPQEFLANVWPWFFQVAEAYAEQVDRRINRYRDDPVFELRDDSIPRAHAIVGPIESAVSAFATAYPAAFFEFVSKHASCELLIVHRLLAIGLQRIASSHPAGVLAYVLGDTRRLTLGKRYRADHTESLALLSSLVPHLQPDQLRRLEEAITHYRFYVDLSSGNTALRRERLQWNREHCLRLLAAIPVALLSEAGQKTLKQAMRRFPHVTQEEADTEPMAEVIESPVSAEQMSKASESDILNLFTKLHDGCVHSHPRDFLRGGSIEASREFGKFAKSNPTRALRLFEQFQPGSPVIVANSGSSSPEVLATSNTYTARKPKSRFSSPSCCSSGFTLPTIGARMAIPLAPLTTWRPSLRHV
jgi:hypothetical protein